MPKSTWHPECPYPRGKEFEACCVGRQGPDVRMVGRWCEDWLWVWWWLQRAQNSSKHQLCQGCVLEWKMKKKQQLLSSLFLKWAFSFPSTPNAAAVSCLLFRHLVLYAHPVLALMQWLGHLSVGPVDLQYNRYNRYNPPFQAWKIFQESWYVSLQNMFCLSPQQRDKATLKAFLTASMCVPWHVLMPSITWWSPRDSRTSCGSKPCCRGQPRCGTCRTFAYLMYQEDVIDQDDQMEWFPAALIQHSKRERLVLGLCHLQTQAQKLFSTPQLVHPKTLAIRQASGFCSWIIHRKAKNRARLSRNWCFGRNEALRDLCVRLLSKA